jgi:hypothetical protein
MYRMASLFSRNCSHRLYIILSGFAIFVGGLIYILLRPSEHVFFGWISMMGLDHLISPARSLSHLFSQLFPNWIVFSLPNGLWAFAYALLITRIWSGSNSWLKYFWMASIPLLVLGFEILQYPGLIPGTFCIQDIALGLLGLVLGIFVGTMKTKNNNYHEKAFE